MNPILRAGALAAIYVSAALMVTTLSHLPAFSMTFASSSVLLATQPGSPAAQPRALIGGHMIAALCGWAAGALIGDGVGGVAIAIGAAVILMQGARALHPPAAVSCYLMIHQAAHGAWLIFPILAGALLLTALAAAARRILPERAPSSGAAATAPGGTS